VLQYDERVPCRVGERLGDAPVPAPVRRELHGERRLQERAREEEEVAGDGDPHYAPHLTLRRDLVDVAEGL